MSGCVSDRRTATGVPVCLGMIDPAKLARERLSDKERLKV